MSGFRILPQKNTTSTLREPLKRLWKLLDNIYPPGIRFCAPTKAEGDARRGVFLAVSKKIRLMYTGGDAFA